MKKPAVLALCVFGGLWGCAVNPPTDGAAEGVSPVMRTTHAGLDADALYDTARYYQGQARYAEAIRVYRELLAKHPEHVEGHNALGALFSTLAEHELAERHFKLALELAPRSAHLYNNLGYAYFLAGRHEDAQASLEQARRLGMDDARLLANLALVARHIGTQAGLGRFSAEGGVAGRNLPAGGDAQATAEVRAAEPRTGLVEVAPHVFELRLENRTATTEVAAAPETPALVRLEVANGNGVRGIARLAAQRLRAEGFPQARLTNARPYRQATTEIHYVAGYEKEAARLGAVMPQQGTLVAVEKLPRGTQIRVVLGKDVATRIADFAVPQQKIVLAHR